MPPSLDILSASPPTAAPERSSGERTRKALLDVARAEFAAKGFAGTRVDEIAAAAGVNKQAIYHHFGNKDGLFRITLELGYEEVLKANLAYVQSKLPEDPAEALAHVIGHLFDRLRYNTETVELVLEENRQKGRHLIRKDLIRDANRPMVDYLRRLLKSGAERGQFAAGVDGKQFFFDLVSLSMFYFANIHTMSAALGDDLGSERSIRARKKHIIGHLLTSVAPRVPQVRKQ